MRRNLNQVLLGLFIVAMFGFAGCGRGGDKATSVPNVAAVTYRISSGAISPDLAWDETYTISPVGLTFIRAGFSASSTVNSGSWTINSYGENEKKLFDSLSGPDVFGVLKTGQGTVPLLVGVGIQDYTIQYDSGVTKEVIIGDGSLYNNSGLVTAPINNYIANIALPTGVSNRYK